MRRVLDALLIVLAVAASVGCLRKGGDSSPRDSGASEDVAGNDSAQDTNIDAAFGGETSVTASPPQPRVMPAKPASRKAISSVLCGAVAECRVSDRLRFPDGSDGVVREAIETRTDTTDHGFACSTKSETLAVVDWWFVESTGERVAHHVRLASGPGCVGQLDNGLHVSREGERITVGMGSTPYYDGNFLDVWQHTYETSPLRLVKLHDHYYRRLQGCASATIDRDWRTLTGLAFLVSCEGADDNSQPPARTTIHQSALIPRLQVPMEFANEGWKTAAFTSCSAQYVAGPELARDEDVENADSTIRVVMSGDTLFLEVTDDVHVETGAVQDRLEVSASTVDGGLDRRSLEFDEVNSTPVETLVLSATGAKTSGWFPVATSAVDAMHQRFRITLQNGVKQAAIRYFDTDDGKTVHRKIVTSTMAPKAPKEFGGIWDIPPEEARCRMDKGALVLARAATKWVELEPTGAHP